jgi:hypothetical protein
LAPASRDTASRASQLRLTERVDPLLAFAAALLALRLAGDLAGRYRVRRTPQLLAWAASLFSYAVASAALAWGSAYGWGEAAFRVYYLFGGLLTAALLGAGSLLLVGRRWVIPVVLVYVGLAVGIAVAEPLTSPVSGEAIPDAQEHLDFIPMRLAAVLGNSLGTIAVIAVAALTFRRRPLANSLIVLGVLAAAGTGLSGLGVAETSAFIAGGAVLLYAGFVQASRKRDERRLDARGHPV